MDSKNRLPSSCPYIVVPTYNEVTNVERLVKGISEIGIALRILFVDDSSPDGTAIEVRRLADLGYPVELLLRPEKSGLGSAYRDGFSAALSRGATAVIEMDADMSHSPSTIRLFLDELDLGPGLVIGSRYVRGGSSPGLSPLRLVISRLGNWYAAKMLMLPIKDSTSGFRAFNAEMLRRIDFSTVRADGYGFQIEMAYLVTRTGSKVSEIAIAFQPRYSGSSKMSGKIIREAMILCTVMGLRDRLQIIEKKLDSAGQRNRIPDHLVVPFIADVESIGE